MFGGGDVAIGTGIVFSLVDQFSDTADKIKKKWGELEGVTDQAIESMNKGMNTMKMGLAGLR